MEIFTHPEKKCSGKRKTLCLFTISYLALMTSSWADERFNPAMLEQKNADVNNVDLSVFAKKNQQAPGKYHVSLLVNGISYPARDIDFQSQPGQKNLTPCLTLATLKEVGMKVDVLPGLAKVQENTCLDINAAIPGSYTDFDFEQQQLKLTFPQAAMDNQARGYIPPDQWQQGIPALLANYQFSGSHTDYQYDNTSSDQQYLNLRSGFNWDAWRFRNYSTYTQSDLSHRWQSSSTYLQRNIAALKAELTMGDDFTSSDVFDSVQFRGARLASDDNMLPDSMKGFAPVVRGIAKSNATVTIRQNGYVIYQSYVTPGAFTINDLYPTSNSGDLDVTITESDGSTTHFVQPFSSVPMLQREGHLKYDFTLGEYHDNASSDEPKFSQLTLMWGLPHGATIYGGGQFSDDYLSGAVGLGQNLGDFGAISLDVTTAQADLYNNSTSSGQAWRILYAKSLADTGTNIQLSGYRYSGTGYYSFSDAMDYGRREDDSYDYDNSYKKKDRYQISISQSMAGYGSMYANASKERYWDQRGNQTLVQVGYNNTFFGISTSLSYNFTGNPGDSDKDHQFAMSISVPLSKFTSNAWVSYNITQDNHGRTSQQAGINGTLLKDRNLNYSAQESHSNQGVGSSGATSMSYLGSYGQINVGYNFDDNQHQVNYGLSGGVMMHQHGLTLSQQLGETVALVRAPGANDVNVQNQTGVKTDWRGYTVLPYVTPYRKNMISLDPSTLPNNVELESTSRPVIPTQGAVVLADFSVRKGYKALLTLTQAGKPVPFGATVSVDGDSTNASFVGDSGQAFLTGLQEQGELWVKWGRSAQQQCHVVYHLSDAQMADDSLSFVTEALSCAE
jgi:outer membrane usher protein